MTIYEKELARIVGERYGDIPATELLAELGRIGVLDYTRCKALAVREYVAQHVADGSKKIDSMWDAAEKFCCSYEYVRKCVYYYRDVNF